METPPGGVTDAPASERRLVSILFADLVGFTTLSEARDSEEVRDLLSRYFEMSRRVIERYGGVVEKFIGDAVMAVWGTPVANEDDAERAVRAALDLTDAVAAMGEEVGAPALRARAGVLTGEAAVTIGAQGQGMVAGDLVNTASRIQSTAPPGGVFVGDVTKRATDAAVEYEDAGSHELKGKAEPMSLWRALRVIAGARGDMRVSGLEPPFVGRERQLRMIKDLFNEAGDLGRAQLVSVVGPAGIGKSRLAWEFFKYIDGLADVTRWHSGRCLAYGEGVTYWALAEMVRTNADILEGEATATALPKLREAVGKVFPDEAEQRWVEQRLASLLGLENVPSRERDDLFAAWRLFYERLADEMPTVMVFEDLQWADDALLDFIEYLLEWSRAHRIFILTFARPELLERRPDWGSGRSSASIYLEPLPEGAMAALLSGLVPGLPDELSDRVLDRAEGVPLYAVETVRMLLDKGFLTEDADGYRAVASIDELDVPETLHGLIAARLDGLTGEERRLVQDAAVLGKTFTKEAIGAVSRLEPAELDALLASLLRKELLGVHAERFSPERGQYVFLGDLIRWVAYETLSKKERRSRHLAVARWFEQLGDEEAIEVVASHYVRAYEAEPSADDADDIRERALVALVRAAERAASLGANGEAGRRFEQGADLARAELERAELLERAGDMALRERRHEHARNLFARATSIFDGLGLTHPAARVSARVAEMDWVDLRLDEAIDRMRAAYETLSTEEHDRDLAMLAAQLARMSFFRGDLDRSEEVIEVAIDIAESEGLPDVISQALNTKAMVLLSRGHLEECRALLERALQVALDHDLPSSALRAYNNLAELLVGRDRYEDGIAIFERGIALAERIGDAVWQRGLMSEIVFPLMLVGRWDDALRHAAQVPDADKPGGDTIGLVVSIPVILIARGDVEAAEHILAIFEGFAHSADVQEASAYDCARASLLRARSRDDEALDAAQRAVAGGMQIGVGSSVKIGLTQAVAASLSLHDLDAAARLIAMIDDMPPGRVTPFLRATADRSRGQLAALRGDHGRAEPAFKAAIGLFRETGNPYWRALTQLDHGEWLVSRERSDEAKELLDEARATFRQLGATASLERLERIMPAPVRSA